MKDIVALALFDVGKGLDPSDWCGGCGTVKTVPYNPFMVDVWKLWAAFGRPFFCDWLEGKGERGDGVLWWIFDILQ